MKETLKIGYIGLGRRGSGILQRCLCKMEDAQILYICDTEDARLERNCAAVQEAKGYTPKLTKDYRDILNDPEVDAVFIMTGWGGRPQLAMEAMRAGKYTAIEVGCADTLQECWDLVDTYEQTGTPVMMLENACYCRRELMALQMKKLGTFGEIVHCTGAYAHYLNDCELFKDIDTTERKHYRLDEYIERNRENYPTHDLGPIAKVLSVNRGNKMNRLVSVASKSCGLKQYAKDHLGEDSRYANIDYKQGDIVNTLITCENGETILLTLDTTLPRAYYSRQFSVRGTKAMVGEERQVVYLEGMEEGISNNEADFYDRFDHPIYKNTDVDALAGGHGGVDWLVCRAFIESAKRGIAPPIDVYDTASWMSIGPLSQESIRTGEAVEIPDFTRGKWAHREPPIQTAYCLDDVIEE